MSVLPFALLGVNLFEYLYHRKNEKMKRLKKGITVKVHPRGNLTKVALVVVEL
jgi:hypothetical protein